MCSYSKIVRVNQRSLYASTSCTYLVYDEVQALALPAAREDIVAGLRGAVPHEEVAILVHDLFSALPWDGPMVPSM